ncbi:hypothetical protein CAL14_14990 [Bordetella genomosp. 9]|uniref:type II toxin-antitoxin system Phd/YefM family antitoxin n=1 Tax=Bordetella genomosp. 9 TaxID=1416803 RepID=UPI000A2977A6|nr:type II toxin-antitoxin system Phd/YefM family antitoxin [Bordetella genomosp. 9]ARP91433.1 hypothetical protein CAL14_14990 [Bordetella genomosp. 9]
MRSVNIHEANTSLSKLIEAIELGKEAEIVISRNGRPAAKLVAITKPRLNKRLGVAKGKFQMPDDIDKGNDEIASLFSVRAADERSSGHPHRTVGDHG